MTSEKIDFKTTLDIYRARHGEFRVVEVPELQYLVFDGHGDPNTSPIYAQALEALYPLAFKLKFLSKRELGRDYVVPPLEGLWSAADMASFTTARDKSQWDWTMMLMVPDWLGHDHVERARGHVRNTAGVDRVELRSLQEGYCVQTLHRGAFDDEGPVLERLHAEVIPAHGFTLTGKHHEIYLSDPRRVEPAKLRTILRQPVAASPGLASEEGQS